ncbi:MAG: hypothetical protein ACI4SV_02030 [Duodenibacillus sp.]
MSLPPPKNKTGINASAIIGACLAVIASVPAAAFLASLFGDTYTVRATVYCSLLLWACVGAGVIFYLTRHSEGERFSAARLVLWFVSAWLWPLLLLANTLKKR